MPPPGRILTCCRSDVTPACTAFFEFAFCDLNSSFNPAPATTHSRGCRSVISLAIKQRSHPIDAADEGRET
jgi:hypothetical protein